jgi:hypothetical protein
MSSIAQSVIATRWPPSSWFGGLLALVLQLT